MAAQFVTTLISLGISLLPSLSAVAFSFFFSNNNSGKKRRVVEEDPKSLIQTIELIQATLYNAEQREIKDRSFKLWLKELKNVAREAKDLLREYRHVETRVRTKIKDMRYIVPIPDGIIVRLNQIRNKFEKIKRDRQSLQLSSSDEVCFVEGTRGYMELQGRRVGIAEEMEIRGHRDIDAIESDVTGYVADEREIRNHGVIQIYELQSGTIDDWVGVAVDKEIRGHWASKLMEAIESDETGYVADEQEIREHGVIQATESDEVECVAEESEIRDCQALQLSKRDEVGYASEERDIKHREALQLSKSYEGGCTAKERDIRDRSDVRSEHQTTAESFEFNSNLSREHLHVLNDGTTEHFKRIMSYVKGSMLSISTLIMIAIFMSTLKQRGNVIFIKATSICLFISLFSNVMVMELSEDTQTPSRNCFPHQHKDHLYIFIYASTFMLMLCGLFLLLFSNANYGPLGIFPALTLIIMIGLFLRGYQFGHTRSATNYREHDGTLQYYSEFSSAGTIATFIGLSTYVSSSPTHLHQNSEVNPTEIALYIAAVTSLLLRQLTTVPPVVSHDNMRARVMEAMRYLSYIMVGLLFSVALLATGVMLRGVISVLIYIAGTMIFVVVIVIKVQLRDTNKPEEQIELDANAMVVVDLTFGVLMAVYSKYVDDRTWVNDQYFQLLVCTVCLCTAFIMSLSKALLVSDGTTHGAWPRVKMISSNISYALAFVAVVTLLLTL